MSKRPMLLAVILTGAIAVSAVLWLWGRTPRLHGSAIEPPVLAPPLNLVDTTGQPYELSADQGKVVLVFFGYTNCPDECPLTMAHLTTASSLLGSEAGSVRVLLVTTDPERDTPEVLGDYVNRFDPAFVGLTGAPQQLASVWKEYGVTVMAGGETHSTYLYVIDPQGRLVETLSHDAEPSDIAADVRILLGGGRSQ